MKKIGLFFEKRPLLTLAFNLSILLTISFLAFQKNHAHLLAYFDGSYMMELIRQQLKWELAPYTGFTSNIFQSLGNVYFPLNAKLIPAYFISAKICGGMADKTFSHLILSLEIYVSIYLFCVNFKFKPLCGLLAGAFFLYLIFPYAGAPPIYNFFVLVPHVCTGIAEMLLLTVLFSKLIQEPARILPWYLLAIFALLAHIMVSAPGSIMLMAPFLSAFGLCCILSTPKIAGALRMTLTFLGILTLFYALGFFHYVSGLFSYTAATHFSNELLVSRADWHNVSILFQPPYTLTIGLVSAALLGAAIDLFKNTPLKRNIAITFILYTLFLLLFGLYITKLNPNWQGPVPLYFEICIWPIYCIYFSNLLVKIYLFSVNKAFEKDEKEALGLASILLPLGLAMVFLFILYQADDTPKVSLYPYPPKKLDTIDILEKEIGVAHDPLFRGRVATFTGQSAEPTNWYQLHAIDCNYVSELGNDLRLNGFSHFDIPTFFEYSPFITPAFYAATKSVFAHPQDEQLRNVMTLRIPNIKFLQLFGVKFFITDVPVKTSARLRFSETSKVFLYELPITNTGQYSPTQPILATSLDSSLKIMTHTTFDPQHSVIVHKPLSKTLVKASNATMRLQPGGGIALRASSNGDSLLVLPLEYSHCLDLQNNTQAKILRVNGMQVGILFHGKLNATLTYFTGPFHNASCRLEDLADFKQLKTKH